MFCRWLFAVEVVVDCPVCLLLSVINIRLKLFIFEILLKAHFPAVRCLFLLELYLA